MPNLKEQLDEQTRMLITITTEIAEIKAKIQPLKQQLNAAIAEKARLKEAGRVKLSQLNSKYNSYKTIDQDIQRYTKSVEKTHNHLKFYVKLTDYIIRRGNSPRKILLTK